MSSPKGVHLIGSYQELRCTSSLLQLGPWLIKKQASRTLTPRVPAPLKSGRRKSSHPRRTNGTRQSRFDWEAFLSLHLPKNLWELCSFDWELPRITLYLKLASAWALSSVLLRIDMMDVTWLSAILMGAGCLAFGYLIGVRNSARKFLLTKIAKDTAAAVDGNKKGRVKQPLEIEKLAEIIEDFKMVLVVRNDLKMGKGKIAAQCSHATLGLYKKIANRAPKSLSRWEMCGQVKVVVKIESEDDLLVLQERAKSLTLPTHIVIDAGRTQIAPNSRTVMAILGPAEMVDDVTGGLKLL